MALKRTPFSWNILVHSISFYLKIKVDIPFPFCKGHGNQEVTKVLTNLYWIMLFLIFLILLYVANKLALFN